MNKPYEAAKKICIKGCGCTYESCTKPQRNRKIKIPPLGTNTICPLAKYDIQDRELAPWWERPASDDATLNDCFTLCAACEHATYDEAGGIVTRNNLYSHCLDCPVKLVEDCIREAQAEGAGS